MSVPRDKRILPAESSSCEEIVISGLAGCFPQSKNVYHLRDNLFNKVDMVAGNDWRWKFGQYIIFH
jgi:hypothetical protein